MKEHYWYIKLNKEQADLLYSVNRMALHSTVDNYVFKIESKNGETLIGSKTKCAALLKAREYNMMISVEKTLKTGERFYERVVLMFGE